MALPLFITCAFAPCGVVVQVKNPYQQRRRRYCSHRCAALAHRRSPDREKYTTTKI